MGRTEEGTDLTRSEMTVLLEVLIGANVKENLVVMVHDQSILRGVGEGDRTFLSLSSNPDILWMVFGRLYIRIAHGTTTFLCKIKIHRGESLNETTDDLTDLDRTIDPEHGVWTTRFKRMVFSCIDGQKSERTSTWNQGVRNGVRLGAGRYRFETRPEGLGPRSHGKIESSSTLGTTHGYVDKRLPFLRKGREGCHWRTVER